MSASLAIAICTFNNARLLERTLQSAEIQCNGGNYQWSVVVVDNNCTDNTTAVVDRYVGRGKIPRLRKISEPQQGLTYARRRAVRETSEDIIAFVDDDCLLAEDWVGQTIRFCEGHLRAGAVGGKVDLEWEAPPDAVALKFQSSFAHQDKGAMTLALPLKG